MPDIDEQKAAITNRSLRTIRTSAKLPSRRPILLSMKNKISFYAPSPSPVAPPPAYASAASVATATALYEYHPTDAGDLAVVPHDRIFITEFMNADWAKGRNERTGSEGIFPRSYVAIIDEKNKMGPYQPPTPSQTSYGNMPLDVSQAGSSATPGKPSKFEEHGKKFGKKLGNASMFTVLAI
ncbi:uncharacterized protein KY384_006161 [Bacidia gigantensis]|uniref:uncharacterized protein n=1 Tax=Bacidia gigantensis TaxID=2732470 RepID=UPI001D059294|nr:uncharacterized protein KY384_006161 [Bacidia gigantensis]KAG8529524.1 hypothetical protein KY384_006161 [Bacidia gigantensis]